jgi:hypothetical protein
MCLKAGANLSRRVSQNNNKPQGDVSLSPGAQVRQATRNLFQRSQTQEACLCLVIALPPQPQRLLVHHDLAKPQGISPADQPV